MECADSRHVTLCDADSRGFIVVAFCSAILHHWMCKIPTEVATLTNLTENRINKKLCNKLHISEIRFNNHDTVWGDGSKITDHYKFMMVDRQMFYVGSQNFYF
ncbi:hypothetical protein PsalMR5_02994 [Piscirickettsia salmonis]|nr:hypothetical protein PsalSR1_02986 [Piscirickettsia salmonis]QGP58621.1 hypothetical protein PsalBI1_01193 [Piscirickettsia salmonis]QGP65106.1 hypothetical protein PsalMR5_02994 [Piscirickettsia salmonis]